MFVRTILRSAALAGLALLIWSVLARPSGAHGVRAVYRVGGHDTLWSIATSHYNGDPRTSIWQIETANHLAGGSIYPGEMLVLP